jgi:hypothetical protein
MAVSLYSTQELLEVQQRLQNLPDGFWRNRYTRVITSDREEILFEVADRDNRKLAPFVAPNVQGRVMRGQGYEARTFRPAYVKPKHIVDPTKAIPRMMGEPIMGGMSMAARFDAVVANNMRLELESIQRRWDWMAARATIDGFVLVEGDDYPSTLVDFGRDPNLTIQLTGTTVWSATGTANPLQDLADANDAAFALGNAPITDLVFGITAYANFIKNADVKELLSTMTRASNSSFATIPLIQNENYQSMGYIDSPGGGRFNLWRYSNWYSAVSSSGALTVEQFLDPTYVVGLGPGLDGTALFGAIMDYDAGFQAEATVFPKMWTEKDPSVVYTMSQSAPLFAPLNPNNSFVIKTEAP